MPLTILVADDSVTMRKILEMTFAGEDARVVAVESGEQAIAKADELKPDVIFADLSLPTSDAYEVSRAVKSKSALANTCVIALASQHTPYDDAKGRAAGIDDHVVKPFDTQVVIGRVAQVLAKPRAMPAGAGAAAAPPPAAPAAAPAAAAAAAAAAARSRTATIGFGTSPVAPPAAPPAAAARPPAPAAPVAPPAAAPRAAAPVAAAPAPAAAAPAARPPAAAPAAAAAPKQATPAAEPPASPIAAATAAASADFAGRLGGLGLTPEQVDGVMKISRDVIERVAWEVVPELAETIIREEIRRLTQ